MTKKTFWFLKILLIVAMYGTGFLVFGKLPEMIPVHWNFEGVADNFWPKLNAILLLPSITLFMALLFPLLSKIDPKKEKYEQFGKVWEIFQLIFVLFFTYIYMTSLYVSLNPQINITPFILAGIGILFLVIGNYMGKIRQNYFVGIKTPWTLNDEEIWNKTHRLGGWCFMAGGILFLLMIFLKSLISYAFLIIVIIVAIGPIIYSYVLYRKKKTQKN